ncbi:MAG: hypothetical protein IJE08_15215 [Clostridia bacterium]|nr:hypothetical protein [Clostridia bacterium]
MPVIHEDKIILRALAHEYMECAILPVNREREQRARQTNGLRHVRPLVTIAELPWNELNTDGQLTLHCADPAARDMERFFRRSLLQWKYFQGDMILEPFYRIQKAYDNTGYGVERKEDILAIDRTNHIVSHHYEDLLDTEEALERLHLPVIAARPDQDAERLAFAEEVLSGIMPVKLAGTYIYCSIWDQISMLRGVGPLYLDLALRPEFMHETMRRFTEIHASMIDQMDEQGLFTSDIRDLHCTPGYSDELDEIERKNGKGTRASGWFRGLAQPFSSVSPEMHEEFEVDYIRPIAETFGFTYYGCCEPLHDRLEGLMKIKNLRKVGCTPWADVNSTAEQLGKNYVLSRKPNPAMVAGTLDEDAIRKEVRETAEACIRYGCPWDYTLKDISTASYKIENLTRWNEVVQETLDEYYGR